MTEIRTYETFDIVWSDGTRWTGYDTEAEANAAMLYRPVGGRLARIERRTFEVEISPETAHLYRPGIEQ